MLYLLADDYAGAEKLAEIRRLCGEPDLVSLNTTDLEGAKLTFDDLVQSASAMPFLSDKRLVIVRSLSRRVKASSASGDGPAADDAEAEPSDEGAPAARSSGKSGLLAEIAAWLPQLSPTTELVLIETSDERGNLPASVVNLVKKAKGEIHPPRHLGPSELIRWVGVRARNQGGKISSEAAQALVRAVGDDQTRLDREIEKLVTYSLDEEITPATVQALVSEVRDENIFHLVEAIGRGDRRDALALARTLLWGGAQAPYLLIMITRQYRMALGLRDAETAGQNDRTIAAALGIKGDWQLSRLREGSRRQSTSQLRRAYGLLLEADRAIKLGRLSGDLAIELLIAELTEKRTS